MRLEDPGDPTQQGSELKGVMDVARGHLQTQGRISENVVGEMRLEAGLLPASQSAVAVSHLGIGGRIQDFESGVESYQLFV